MSCDTEDSAPGRFHQNRNRNAHTRVYARTHARTHVLTVQFEFEIANSRGKKLVPVSCVPLIHVEAVTIQFHDDNQRCKSRLQYRNPRRGPERDTEVSFWILFSASVLLLARAYA